MTKYYAYIKRSGGDDWGCDLSATTEPSAKREARRIFGGDYRDAVINLMEWHEAPSGERVKIPVACAYVSGQWEQISA